MLPLLPSVVPLLLERFFTSLVLRRVFVSPVLQQCAEFLVLRRVFVFLILQQCAVFLVLRRVFVFLILQQLVAFLIPLVKLVLFLFKFLIALPEPQLVVPVPLVEQSSVSLAPHFLLELFVFQFLPVDQLQIGLKSFTFLLSLADLIGAILESHIHPNSQRPLT
jgi:hypothetical protein